MELNGTSLDEILLDLYNNHQDEVFEVNENGNIRLFVDDKNNFYGTTDFFRECNVVKINNINYLEIKTIEELDEKSEELNYNADFDNGIGTFSTIDYIHKNMNEIKIIENVPFDLFVKYIIFLCGTYGEDNGRLLHFHKYNNKWYMIPNYYGDNNNIDWYIQQKQQKQQK